MGQKRRGVGSEDHEALATTEQNLQNTDEFIIIDSFTKIKGFSEVYMNELTQAMREAGFTPHYETSSASMALEGGQGINDIFQLKVPPEEVETAKEFVAKYRENH